MRRLVLFLFAFLMVADAKARAGLVGIHGTHLD